MHRSESRFINMRKKHNKIKDILIQTAVKKVRKSKEIRLLDISVGRFGDLHKYMKSGVNFVLGIDPCTESIIEADRRLKNSNKNSKFEAELFVDTITDDEIPISIQNKRFDVVVCNFTLHYFFEKESYLHNVFRHVSNVINKGGYFIGTSIDGSKIDKHVKKNDNYEIDKFYDVPLKSKFGNKYTFKLFDNEDSGLYFIDKDITEYLVDVKTFLKIARDYDFKLLKLVEFDKYTGFRMDEHEEDISNMYFSFVFCKE